MAWITKIVGRTIDVLMFCVKLVIGFWVVVATVFLGLWAMMFVVIVILKLVELWFGV